MFCHSKRKLKCHLDRILKRRFSLLLSFLLTIYEKCQLKRVIKIKIWRLIKNRFCLFYWSVWPSLAENTLLIPLTGSEKQRQQISLHQKKNISYNRKRKNVRKTYLLHQIGGFNHVKILKIKKEVKNEIRLIHSFTFMVSKLRNGTRPTSIACRK